MSKTQNHFVLLKLLQTRKTCTAAELAAEMQINRSDAFYCYGRQDVF